MLHAAAGQHEGEALDVVVAAVTALRHPIRNKNSKALGVQVTQ